MEASFENKRFVVLFVILPEGEGDVFWFVAVICLLKKRSKVSRKKMKRGGPDVSLAGVWTPSFHFFVLYM